MTFGRFTWTTSRPVASSASDVVVGPVAWQNQSNAYVANSMVTATTLQALGQQGGNVLNISNMVFTQQVNAPDTTPDTTAGGMCTALQTYISNGSITNAGVANALTKKCAEIQKDIKQLLKAR